MSTHTPGPWFAKQICDANIDGPTIRTGPTNVYGLTMLIQIARINQHGEQTIANASLIAAAPELLEACKLLADWVRRRCPADDWPREFELATRAIAKAEGEGRI